MKTVAESEEIRARSKEKTGAQMTMEQEARPVPMWRGIVRLLGAFAGLCTVFSLVATAAEAWQEHAQAHWPMAAARVERCVVDQSSSGRRNRYYIDCRLSYPAGSEEVMTRLYSRQVIAAEDVILGTQRVGVGDLQEWVDQHPPGSAIAIRYDPDNHKKVLTRDLPLGGPHTPDNIRLTEYTASLCVVLLTVGTLGRKS